MKKLLILMAALLLTGCEQENILSDDGAAGDVFKKKPQTTLTDKSKITGLWESNSFVDGSMTQKIRMQFDENQEKVVLGSECKFADGATLYVQVEASAIFENGGAEVTDSDQDSATKQNGVIKYECFASLTPQTFKIGLNGKITVENFILNKIAD